MPLISLNGPNAIGKTTAMGRWLLRYPRLYGVIADNQWEARNVNGQIVKERVREWKDALAAKRDAVEALRSKALVAVIDSVRTTCVNFFGPEDHAIFVVCSWQTMERVLRARCAANGKRFRDDYWNVTKFTYESRLRYENAAAKFLRPEQCRFFTVEDQARDWVVVDEYFGRLYRKLHNEAVGRRRATCQSTK